MTPQINLNEAIGRDIIVNSLFGIKKKIDKIIILYRYGKENDKNKFARRIVIGGS